MKNIEPKAFAECKTFMCADDMSEILNLFFYFKNAP